MVTKVNASTAVSQVKIFLECFSSDEKPGVSCLFVLSAEMLPQFCYPARDFTQTKEQKMLTYKAVCHSCSCFLKTC